MGAGRYWLDRGGGICRLFVYYLILGRLARYRAFGASPASGAYIEMLCISTRDLSALGWFFPLLDGVLWGFILGLRLTRVGRGALLPVFGNRGEWML